MKSIKFIVGLVFMLFCSLGNAQDSLYVDSQKVDSLSMLLENHLSDDIERVKLLNEYARLSFYHRDLIQGFEATIQARDIAKKIGYKEGEILYHETLAAFLGDGDMVCSTSHFKIHIS